MINLPAPSRLATLFLGICLLAAFSPAWSKPTDTIRAITGDCNGGADVTVIDEAWGRDECILAVAMGCFSA